MVKKRYILYIVMQNTQQSDTQIHNPIYNIVLDFAPIYTVDSRFIGCHRFFSVCFSSIRSEMGVRNPKSHGYVVRRLRHYRIIALAAANSFLWIQHKRWTSNERPKLLQPRHLRQRKEVLPPRYRPELRPLPSYRRGLPPSLLQ
jgi:hypothetical protein